MARLYAFISVIILFLLVWAYVREFAYISNTIEIKTLIALSLGAGLAFAFGLIFLNKNRLTPWGRHVPEMAVIVVFSILFAPLFISVVNRVLGSADKQSFEFVAEKPYLSGRYGVVKGEAIRPTGYYLYVKENGSPLRFRYAKQAYYPLTQAGEKILLPLKKGLFGIRVMTLR